MLKLCYMPHLLLLVYQKLLNIYLPKILVVGQLILQDGPRRGHVTTLVSYIKGRASKRRGTIFDQKILSLFCTARWHIRVLRYTSSLVILEFTAIPDV